MAKISSWHFRHQLEFVWLKKACKRGGHGHPRTPLATPLVLHQLSYQAKWELGPVSRKSRKLFGPEKPFVKPRPAYSVKPVFSYVVNGIKIKITAKFRASRRLSFEDTKRIMSPEMRPKSLGTFEKQARGRYLGSNPRSGLNFTGLSRSCLTL